MRSMHGAALALAAGVLTLAPPRWAAAQGHGSAGRTVPTSGFFEGRFFVADPSGRFFLSPSGRFHLDTVVQTGGVLGDYATPSGEFRAGDVKPTMYGARMRTELLGGWLDRYTLQLSFEFGTGTAALGAQYNTPSLQNAIFNVAMTRSLNLTLGMFNTPFTIENRTSSNSVELIERSITVRSFGLLGTKEWGAMLWGEDSQHVVYGSLALLGGDSNRNNADANAEVAGRFFVHPFARVGGILAGLQVGGSFLYSRAGASVNYAYQSMRTVGGYTWFSPSRGSGASASTVVPDGDQIGAAAELMVPLGNFDLRAELVYRDNGVREMEGSNLQGAPARAGTLRGTSHYVLLGYWLLGTPRINGSFGYQNPFRVRFDHLGREEGVRRALQLNVRWEMTNFSYQGASRGGPVASAASSRDGDYTLIALAIGANYWIERYLRFSLAYFHYVFPDAAPAGAPVTGFNRAEGPHAGDGSRVSSFGELMARVGVQF